MAAVRIQKADTVDALTGFRQNAAAASGKVLRGDGTNFISANPRVEDLATGAKARAYRATASAAQVMAGTGAFVVCQFDTKSYDPNANFDNVTNFNYTVPVTGYYAIDASWAIASNADAAGTQYTIAIYVNGAEVSRGLEGPIQVGALNITVHNSVSDQLFLTATDTVDIRVAQNSGANRNSIQYTADNHFAIHLMSSTAA